MQYKAMVEDIKVIDLGFVNAFLVKATDGFILIDTGPTQAWYHLEAELKHAECLPDRLKLVMITHGDFDHTGNCAVLQRRYGAKIAMHPGDLEMVVNGVPLNRRIKGIFGWVFRWLEKRQARGFMRFRPDILLSNEQVISGYGLTARIIHTPGHTKGSVSILLSDGQLFVGDVLSNRVRPGLSPFIEDAEELNRSLDALKQTGAQRVYPGHGRPFNLESILTLCLKTPCP
jgi:hydroxyacylglutathione hydrolase